MNTPELSTASAGEASKHGDGTPGKRFCLLMAELEKRFPDPEPYRSDSPEIRLLARIDAALAASPAPGRAPLTDEQAADLMRSLVTAGRNSMSLAKAANDFFGIAPAGGIGGE